MDKMVDREDHLLMYVPMTTASVTRVSPSYNPLTMLHRPLTRQPARSTFEEKYAMRAFKVLRWLHGTFSTSWNRPSTLTAGNTWKSFPARCLWTFDPAGRDLDPQRTARLL